MQRERAILYDFYFLRNANAIFRILMNHDFLLMIQPENEVLVSKLCDHFWKHAFPCR